jgi:hypothetical protein
MSKKRKAKQFKDRTTAIIFYVFDPDAVLPGDILLTSTPSVKSKLIRKATKSEFSHAAICIDYGHFIEAIGSGVCRFAIKGVGVRNRANVRLLRMDRSLPNSIAISRFAAGMAHEDLQRGYSVVGALGVVLPTKADEAALFCSQLVVEAYDKAMKANGLFAPLVPTKQLNKIAPGHLIQSPYLVDVTDQALRSVTSVEGPHWYLDEPSPTERPHQWETIQKLKILGEKTVQMAAEDAKPGAAPRSFYQLELLLRETKNQELDAAIAAALEESNFCENYYNRTLESVDRDEMVGNSVNLVGNAVQGILSFDQLTATIADTRQLVQIFEEDLKDRTEQHAVYVQHVNEWNSETFRLLGVS